MNILTVMLVLGAVIGVFVLVSHLREKKRTERLRQIAEVMGLPFYPEGDPALIMELSQFPLFSYGRDKKLKNLMHGATSDVEAGVFDFRYTTGSGKSSHTYDQTVACFRSPGLDCPDFALRPEHLMHRIGGMFGYQDIDFESHPQFSKSYLLRGASELKIRELYNDEVLDFFENHPGLSVEGSGQRIVFYRASKRVKPDEIRSFFEEGFRVFALLKG